MPGREDVGQIPGFLRPEGTKLKLLIHDTDPRRLTNWVVQLDRPGRECHIARTDVEAREMLRLGVYDLVCLHPATDGLSREAMKQSALKANPACRVVDLPRHSLPGQPIEQSVGPSSGRSRATWPHGHAPRACATSCQSREMAPDRPLWRQSCQAGSRRRNRHSATRAAGSEAGIFSRCNGWQNGSPGRQSGQFSQRNRGLSAGRLWSWTA